MNLDWREFATVPFERYSLLPSNRGVGYVYVLTVLVNDKEIPFYVGQTKRLRLRMEDYDCAQFQACTDFRVGTAIRLFTELNAQVSVRCHWTDSPAQDERRMIRELVVTGSRLLNALPSYKYREADQDEERSMIQRFCFMVVESRPKSLAAAAE